MESVVSNFKLARPFLAVMFIQFGRAGMSIIAKFALDHGMSQYVLVVYRHGVATIVMAPFAILFERKVRPKMTLSIFVKIALMGLLEPVIDQNLYYTGMKYTTATFTTAMCNILPAFAFFMAWVCRLEKVNIKKRHSQAKILGTIVTIGGAMVMTLIKGPIVPLAWTNVHQDQTITSVIKQDPLKGALLITIGCFCWSLFIILQAITLKSYPAELSLTTLICLTGTVQGAILAFAVERTNRAIWALHLDAQLVAVVYSGVISSGIAYYFQGMAMKEKGPVFVTAFNPLSMIIVAILSSFVLAEIMYFGRVAGAIVIVVGLYLVLWGKSKDQPPSTLNIEDKTLPINQQFVTTTSNQDDVPLDVIKVKSNVDSF